MIKRMRNIVMVLQRPYVLSSLNYIPNNIPKIIIERNTIKKASTSNRYILKNILLATSYAFDQRPCRWVTRKLS